MLYEPHAYGEGPRAGCAWHRPQGDWPALEGAGRTEVAIIGAGFTGLSAALHLARAGARVTVLEGRYPGWGASGRNGGFCCLGGARLGPEGLARRYGEAEAQGFLDAQCAAIDTVRALIDTLGIDAQTHSDGELVLAHSARAARALEHEAESLARRGLAPRLVTPEALGAMGAATAWARAGLIVPVGFGLEPGRLVQGLADAAQAQGARIHAQSPVRALAATPEGWRLETQGGVLTAHRLIVATNGYSADDLPPWMRARVLPVQSNVLVTRPLDPAERARQGWTTDLMAYDSRHLLHYFRALPDGRFMFGMRGGISAGPRAQEAARAATRAHFRRLFPAWREVEITHQWSGLAALTPALRPFVGPVGPGAWAGFGYHGNGVAFGTWAGARLAELALGRRPDMPAFLGTPPGRYALGPWRRGLLRLAYPAYRLADMI